MEEIYAGGRVRAIGVSNFQPHHLRNLFGSSEVRPAVNQIEVHPFLTQDELRAFDAEHQIVTEAWAPIARGKVERRRRSSPRSREQVGKTPAQVTLRWHIQRGDVVFPKSVDPQPGRGELRHLRLRARRVGDGGDLRAEPRRAHRPEPGRVQLRPGLSHGVLAHAGLAVRVRRREWPDSVPGHDRASVGRDEVDQFFHPAEQLRLEVGEAAARGRGSAAPRRSRCRPPSPAPCRRLPSTAGPSGIDRPGLDADDLTA